MVGSASGIPARCKRRAETPGHESCGTGGIFLSVGSVAMSLGLILLIVLVLVLVGVLPTWGYSNGWGYAPSGLVGVVVVVLLFLWILGGV
jgi:hypothetical protein